MPFPDFADIGDPADLSLDGSVNLLLASVAFEEFALANLINAEAEKIQYILGTLEGQTPNLNVTLDEILKVNRCADQTLRDIIKKEILLQFKLENILDFSPDSTTTTTTPTTTTSAAPTSTTTTPTTTTSAAPTSTTTIPTMTTSAAPTSTPTTPATDIKPT